MGKIVNIDLEAEAITDLTLQELERIRDIVKASIPIARKREKKKAGAQGSLFNTAETNSEIKTTFEKSNASNWSVFEKEFLEAEQLGIDIRFYYDSVKNWSLKKPSVKRTARGWIATALDFIREDKRKRKLVMIENIPANSEDTDAMKAYLNM